MWKIIKGSEADFKGAPEWAEECIYTDKNTVDNKDEFLAWVGQGKAKVSKILTENMDIVIMLKQDEKKLFNK